MVAPPSILLLRSSSYSCFDQHHLYPYHHPYQRHGGHHVDVEEDEDGDCGHDVVDRSTQLICIFDFYVMFISNSMTNSFTVNFIVNEKQPAYF